MAKLSTFLLLESWSHRDAHWHLWLTSLFPSPAWDFDGSQLLGQCLACLWAPTGIRKAKWLEGNYCSWREPRHHETSQEVTWVPWHQSIFQLRFSRNDQTETHKLWLISEFPVLVRRGFAPAGTEQNSVTKGREMAFMLQPARNPFLSCLHKFEGWTVKKTSGRELLATSVCFYH